jgi:aspartyl-tRNA(Asn)/glutamyl-tRNA(Gln) amidotransferase subunit C
MRHAVPTVLGPTGSRIAPEEVREIATLARLRLDDAEVAQMTRDLDAILGYVAALSELDVGSVEPMTHAVPFDCPLRPDEVRPPLPLEGALANAPRRDASFFEVPRVVPGPGRPEDEP